MPPLLMTSIAIVFLPVGLLSSLRNGWYGLHAVIVLGLSWLLGQTMGFPPFSPGLWAWSLVLHFIVINLVIAAAYGWDKRAAICGTRRIPERVLHGLSLVGGTPGAYIASRIFRHKTRKESFRGTFWAIVVIQIVAILALSVWATS